MAFKIYKRQRLGTNADPSATIRTSGMIAFNKAARLAHGGKLQAARFAKLLWDDEAFRIGIDIRGEKDEDTVPVNHGEEIAQIAFFRMFDLTAALLTQTKTYPLELDAESGLFVIDVSGMFGADATKPLTPDDTVRRDSPRGGGRSVSSSQGWRCDQADIDHRIMDWMCGGLCHYYREALTAKGTVEDLIGALRTVAPSFCARCQEGGQAWLTDDRWWHNDPTEPCAASAVWHIVAATERATKPAEGQGGNG